MHLILRKKIIQKTQKLTRIVDCCARSTEGSDQIHKTMAFYLKIFRK